MRGSGVRGVQRSMTPPMQNPVYPHLPEDMDTRLDLGGSWTYAQPVTDIFARIPLRDGGIFAAPGEVVMQGLPYDPRQSFALERVLRVPHGWGGKSIRLRFEAVYSACRVWIDGAPAGDHLGGFTPFDIDVTELVRPGRDLRLTLHIDNDSIADTLANGSKYAAHPLAGIPRKAMLYALPPAHLQNIAATTSFVDGDYDTATLGLDFIATVDGEARVSLIGPDGGVNPLGTARVGGQTRLAWKIAAPLLWDTESPNLHRIAIDYEGHRYVRSFGFREVALREGRFLLNGRPITLRGANHHETHPTTGRADTARWAETDVALLRRAHVNLLRTSHYPPTIELVEACDRLGMLLEVEAPICFAFGQFGHMPAWEDLPGQQRAAMSDYAVAASLEMVAFYRTHPSVIIWSIGNESRWAPPFEASAAAIRAADPTRPLTFNWYKLGADGRDHVDIANHHYPDDADMPGLAADPRPMLIGEFGHLYCYNGHELATDPGLRQRWGELFDRQWRQILDLPNGIGGSIWASHDDYFAVPQPDGSRQWVGYGEWGPLDGWRRPKPEYEQLRRVFDPVQLETVRYVTGRPISVGVTNRFDFADLDEVQISWRAGEAAGSAGLVAAPGQSAVLELPPTDAPSVELRFALPRLGYDRLVTLSTIGPAAPAAEPSSVTPVEQGGHIVLGGWRLRDNGDGPQIMTPQGITLPLTLLIVPTHPSWKPAERPERVRPLDNIVTGWSAGGMAIAGEAVQVYGTYEQATGQFLFTGRSDGTLGIAYRFTSRMGIRPLQTGLCLSVPLDWDELHWRAAPPAEAFPPDHPSRPVGRARASGRPVSAAQAFAIRDWPWIEDETAQGTNDFRSTKLWVHEASIGASDGKGLRLQADGTSHVRACRHRESIHFMVLDYSGEGSERFLENLVTPRLVGAGDTLSGFVVLEAVG